MNADISALIKEKAPLILAEIKKAKSVLLHCHPSPDPDSVGSALAMKFALEQLGKKATVIKGDSEIPRAFMHFPGAADIVQKNFFEMDLTEFDLFIIQDTASISQVSRFKPIDLPLPMRTVVIDHHASNTGFADINLIETKYPAVGQILYDLFTLWGVKITPDIAATLFMAIYTDTGGFKYPGTDERTFYMAGQLSKIAPNFPKIISEMENSRTLSEIRFQALAIESVEEFFDGKVGLSVLSHENIMKNNVSLSDIHAEQIAPILRSVKKWLISGMLMEIEPGKVKMSFRSKDGDIYDVSKLASQLNGGGHKAAAGATLDLPLEEAKKLVVSKAKELYNL